jgi:hypothetical protein
MSNSTDNKAQPVDQLVKNKPRKKKTGPKPFQPTDEQRRIIGLCSGFGMNWDQLRLLVINPDTGKPISKETLQTSFPEELENGLAHLKAHIATRYSELLDNPNRNEHAVLWGLERIWRIPSPDNPNAQVGIAINGEERRMAIEFVLPSSHKVADLQQALERDGKHLPPPMPAPKKTIDLKANAPTSVPIVQPSAFKKPTGFDWS